VNNAALSPLLIRPALYVLLLLAVSSRPAAAARQEADVPAVPLVYRLSIPDSASHRLHVKIVDSHPANAEITFAIPAWTPGYYQILNYQSDIEKVQASDGAGHSLRLTHPSPRVWSVDLAATTPPPTQVIVEYDVHAHDAGLGFFGSVLDAEAQRGFVNGASAFLYEVGSTSRPIRLETSLPSGWKLATPLSPIAVARNASLGTHDSVPAVYTAESYDDLIDSPLQFGQFASSDFVSDGATFQCVGVGDRDWDRAKVTAVLTKIVHAAIGTFGKPPFQRYVFFYHIGGEGFEGGLEHHNSTVIHLSAALRDGRAEEFQTVSAHEFIHAWNVKRLRPAGLGPFDYAQPVRSASLWWAEGVTDYYADVALYRAGLRDRSWLLTDLATRMEQLDNNPARRSVSLEEASRKAWEGESEGFDGLSYYLKGSLVGLYFDLLIRERTGDRACLDDVMRLLETQYGSKNRGYPEDALLTALEAVAQSDLHAEYAALVRSPGDIAWDAVLAPAGLALRRDEASYLGVQLTEARGKETNGLIVEAVEPGSAAARCGLQKDDRLVALEGTPVTLDSFKTQLRRLPPNSPITLAVYRGNEPVTLRADSGLRRSHYRLTTTGTVSAAGLFLSPVGTGRGAPRPK
jgi:predicted metalloprotease with PDZ domain